MPNRLSNCYEFFSGILVKGSKAKAADVSVAATGESQSLIERVIRDMNSICNEFKDELYKRTPKTKKLNAILKAARMELLGYTAVKGRV